MAQRKTWLSLFFQALLLLAFSAVIVLFMPRAETFSYDYELDKPWRYGDIIASHNFPIYKSDQVVSHERDSVMRLYHPYYTLNDTADAQIARFWANYRDGRLGSLSWKYADYVARLVFDYRHAYLRPVLNFLSLLSCHCSACLSCRI